MAPAFAEMKRRGEPIVAVTAYDFPTARIADDAGVDLILVGDSLGTVVLGYESTLPVTMEDMLHHTSAVTRARPAALVVGDMPFMSYQVSAEQAVLNAGRYAALPDEMRAAFQRFAGDVRARRYPADQASY